MQYRRSDITGVLAVIEWLYYKVIYYYIVSKFLLRGNRALVYWSKYMINCLTFLSKAGL